MSDKADILTAAEISQQYLGNLMDKRGFEVYEAFRDFFVSIFSKPEEARKFLTDEKHYRITSDFQLFDQAYIDNLTACLTVKITAPETYDEMVKIIDKYIRPTKNNEGFNSLYQECSGFLVFLLEHYEGVSGRQALHLSSQLTKFSVSTIKKSYLKMDALADKLDASLPPPMALAALFWTLHSKGIPIERVEAIEKKNERSKKEIEKAVSAYWRFTGKVVRHCAEIIGAYLQEHPFNKVSEVAAMFGVTYPFVRAENEKPAPFAVFFLAVFVLLIESMPDVLQQLEATFTQEMP